MRPKQTIQIYFARLTVHDLGWRFTICEIFFEEQERTWSALYLAWYNKSLRWAFFS